MSEQYVMEEDHETFRDDNGGNVVCCIGYISNTFPAEYFIYRL